MRITGGEWGGRPLLMPKSDCVRPTQDRVREALFNLLQPVLRDSRFLDLFAGSGGVGLEALSRGAEAATFLERDRAVFTTLCKNLEAFGVTRAAANQVDALTWLGLSGTATTARLATKPYSIVFADPPYDWAKANGFQAIAQALITRNLLCAGGYFIAETDLRTDPEALPGYRLVRDRTYGKTRLAIWQREDDRESSEPSS